MSHQETQRCHQDLAERFGSQPTQVMDAAERRSAHHVEQDHEPPGVTRTAVTFARNRNLEREAVVDERSILRDALQRSLGEARIEDMKQEFDRRVERGDFIAVQQEASTPGRSFTTPAMMEMERETIDRMRSGQGQYLELVTNNSRQAIAREYDHLNEGQRTAVHKILVSRDQVMPLVSRCPGVSALRWAAAPRGAH